MNGIADKILEKMQLILILSLSEKGETLDIGCGDQRFTKYLDKAIGIDGWDYNTTHYPSFKNVLDIKAVGEHLPFKNNSFRSVHAHGVLEHIPKIEQARDEIHRILKKDGHLVQLDAGDVWMFLARFFTGRFRQAFHHGLYGQGSGHILNFNTAMWKKLFNGKFELIKLRRWLMIYVYKWKKISD